MREGELVPSGLIATTMCLVARWSRQLVSLVCATALSATLSRTLGQYGLCSRALRLGIGSRLRDEALAS